MRWGILSVAETYIEEILNELDFEALNQFLHEHLRVKQTFEELVSQIITNGFDSIGKEEICQFAFDTFLYELSIAKPIFIKMLVFSLLFSIVHRFLTEKKSYLSDIGFWLIYAVLMTLLMQSLFLVKEIAISGINGLLQFLQALIPTYAMILIFTGTGTTGAYFYEIAFFFMYVIELAIKNILVPGIHLFVVIIFLNHLFEEDKLSKLAEFFEKILGLILKTSFSMIIGIGVVQTLLTSVKDRLAGNVILNGMSSIPGVGNVIGSAGEIVFSCGMLIKNSVGVIGLVVLCVIAVVPVIKIGCFSFLYHAFSILLQPIADARITESVAGVARGCDLYLKMIVYSMMLFFVLLSMITVATSFVY